MMCIASYMKFSMLSHPWSAGDCSGPCRRLWKCHPRNFSVSWVLTTPTASCKACTASSIVAVVCGHQAPGSMDVISTCPRTPVALPSCNTFKQRRQGFRPLAPLAPVHERRASASAMTMTLSIHNSRISSPKLSGMPCSDCPRTCSRIRLMTSAIPCGTL